MSSRFCHVTGRFLAPTGVGDEPLTGSVTFRARAASVLTDHATYLPAPVMVELDEDGYLVADLLAPTKETQPHSWTWEVSTSFRYKGIPVPWRCFDFLPVAGQTLDLGQVAPVPDPVTGEYVTRGEKGDTPTEEDIRPVVESILPNAVEEAVRPLAPSVADSYPPHGDITLEDGKTLHILSLDGEARISFPASGSPGESFILAIVRGAEHAVIPGRDRLANTGSPRSLWLSVVYDGTRWLPAPGQDSSQANMFDEAIEKWKKRFHGGAIDQQNILEATVEAAAWVRTFTTTLASLSDEMDLGLIDAALVGDSTQRATSGHNAARYLYAQYQALVGIFQNMRTATGFFEWMMRNLIPGQPPSQEDAPFFFPPNGHSAILHSDDQGAALILGDAYEVVGLDEGSARLRIRIRPYADESYGVYQRNDGEPIPHEHAGEVYEVPLVRVEEA